MTDAKEENNAKDEKAKQALEKTATEKASAGKEEPVAAEKEKKSGGGGFFTLVLFLLVIGAAAVAGLNYKKLEKLDNELQAAGNVETEMQGVIDSLEQQLQSTRSRFAAVNSKLDELESRQQNLRDLIPEPVTQTIELNEEFALAEIEHLLTIANYRLQLNHDVATAITAMESADLRLQRLDVPGTLQVREQLIADMNSLRSLNQADLGGLGLFLSDLIDRVDGLPLKEDVIVSTPEFEQVKPVDSNDNKLKQFFKLVWAELKSLVIISRDQNVSKVMLLPDEIYFLRSNIKLELANARFAVFNRDTDNFRASIQHIQGWLDNYFDKADAAVKNVDDALRKMSKLELAFPRIDISSSIESVKVLSRKVSASNQPVPQQELLAD